MPPASSVVTTASSMSSSSSDDISLPPSPSPSPEGSPDPYAFSSLDDISAAPPAKKKRPPNRGVTAGWPTADEVVLLEAVAAHKEQHGGGLPTRADLPAALGGRLPHVSAEQAAARLSVLRERYHGSVRKLRRGTVPVTDDGLRVFRLSKRIWEGVPRKEPKPRPAPHHERREFAELEGMYPCLASAVEEIEAELPPAGMACGLMRLAFGLIGDQQAAELEAKVKRQRRAQLKVDAGQDELRNLVAKTIFDEME